MKRILMSPVIALVAFFGLNVATALAHDNAIVAKSVCTSQKNGTWQATFTGTNDFRLGEDMAFTGAVTGTIHVGAFGSASKSVTTTDSSVTAGVYGVWSDGYHNGPPANHHATAFRPENCFPVQHSPVIQGGAVCSTHGKYRVTYHIVNADGGTTKTQFPVRHVVPGTRKQDSLTVTFEYGNGPDQTASAAVILSGNCKPRGVQHPVVKAPRASIQGPCGDPMYRAVFNNRNSTGPVTFVLRYVAFSDNQTHTLRVKVKAGGRYVTRYVHAKGGTAISVRTANGKVLDSGRTAPGGNYGVCPV